LTESKDNQSNNTYQRKSTEKGKREQETNRYNGEDHRKRYKYLLLEEEKEEDNC
jgi:hypothetical protein